MNNDEKILKVLEQQGKALEQQGKVLEALQAGQARLEQGQQEHTNILTDHTRRLRGLKMVLTRVKRDVGYIGKTYNEEIVDNRRRIEHLEAHAGLDKPHKN